MKVIGVLDLPLPMPTSLIFSKRESSSFIWKISKEERQTMCFLQSNDVGVTISLREDQWLRTSDHFCSHSNDIVFCIAQIGQLSNKRDDEEHQQTNDENVS